MPDSAEDDGWLLTVAHDGGGRADVVILDTSDFTGDPVANRSPAGSGTPRLPWKLGPDRDTVSRCARWPTTPCDEVPPNGSSEGSWFWSCSTSFSPIRGQRSCGCSGRAGSGSQRDEAGGGTRPWAGAQVVSVDLRSIEPTAAAIVAAVSTVGQQEQRLVVTVDTFELAGGLGDWMRHHLLELLPAGTVVVVAGGHVPNEEWRAEPTWSSLLHLHALRALTPPESRQLLERCGLAGDLAASVAPIGRGHPLALVLLAEALRGGAAIDVPDDLTTSPDLVAGLLQRIADEAPSRHCTDAFLAMSRVTTLWARASSVRQPTCSMNRRTAPDQILRLREKPADGLCPHDLARDVLEGELRRTDPDAYAQLYWVDLPDPPRSDRPSTTPRPRSETSSTSIEAAR